MRKILLVESNALMRRGIKATIEEAWPRDIECDEAANACEAQQKTGGGLYLMAIIDAALPERSGFHLLKYLHRDHPELPVLMLSFLLEEPTAAKALRLGAKGFLSKSAAPDELVFAVQQVLSGDCYLSNRAAGHLVSHLGPKQTMQLPHETLSGREAQVLRLFGKGKTPSMIAEELLLSVKTVSTYRGRLLKKLRLNNNAELIGYAIRHDLLE